jgi:hypothetical protein
MMTNRNPDTPEGLESQLLVRIHIIQVELPHSTELELRKLHQTRTDSGRASMLELLLRTPDKLGSPPTLRTLPLSLLYKNELGSTIGG